MNKIYECKPGNMPEDIFPDLEFVMWGTQSTGKKRHCFKSPKRPKTLISKPTFVIGDTAEEINQPAHLLTWFNYSSRFKRRSGKYSWAGKHPRYWRVM